MNTTTTAPGELIEIIMGPHDGQRIRVTPDADWLTLWHHEHPYRYMRIGRYRFGLCELTTAAKWGDKL